MAARKGETRGEDIEISSVEVPETSPEERDQEIVDEFCKLLDRSKQLFDNLRWVRPWPGPTAHWEFPTQ